MGYDARWTAFDSWCRGRNIDPVVASVAEVLEYLSSLVEHRAVNTLKGYVSAIAARHAPVDGAMLSLHPLVSQWTKGLLKFKGVPRVLVPSWNLEIVLHALKAAPFEPLERASNKFLTLKTVFLVAITSARRASELHALRRGADHVHMNATNVTLWPDVAFMPKVNSTFHATQPLVLPALHDEPDKQLRLLCVRRMLKTYLTRSALYRADGAEQLFVAYGAKKLGQPISKRRLSAWLVETVAIAYQVQGLPVPMGVKGHQTRKLATSIADMAGVDPQDICNAATWASGSTFVKAYRLNVTEKVSSTFGRQILRVAGSATPADARRWGSYRIPKTKRRQHDSGHVA
jgi:hypothetical protein